MDLHIPEPFALRLRHRIRKRALADRVPLGLALRGAARASKPCPRFAGSGR
jgi:hypothetical protein